MNSDTFFPRLQKWQPHQLPYDLLIKKGLRAILSKLHSAVDDERGTETILMASQTSYLSKKEEKNLRKHWKLSQASQVGGCAGERNHCRKPGETFLVQKKEEL